MASPKATLANASQVGVPALLMDLWWYLWILGEDKILYFTPINSSANTEQTPNWK